MSQYIEQFEKSQMEGVEVAEFSVGDTVIIHKEISEGKKTRIQRFQGLVIKKSGTRSRLSLTVRKIVDGVGVEKTFLVYSPLVKVEVVSKGKAREARLFYLRKRQGKAALRVKVAS